ncbi:MAG: PhaM family polyhydroxyalkanoate granule multifunctional regulatory protein [Paraburkholderia sp.]|uniref:PhaM family polyhydroxyalkanoate granule multifunctional regulatory protein n=1 Tax=Paraburkholderia sp. TaxID=1926495 RepID=UPI003C5558D7
MTDTSGSTPPFPGFPGFPPSEMLDRMWDMMRLTPFGSAFPGAQTGTGSGFGPSLSMMSDMMAPLTNVEELDKRITDMRAVEQWLKLNLNMLQSAIQALEVQRATLATLRAFGAFAQQSMAQPATASPSAPPPERPRPEPAAAPRAEDVDTSASDETEAASAPGYDASAWWNLLQSQFNQIAQFAMAQPAAAASASAGDETPETSEAPEAPPSAPESAGATGKAATKESPAAKRGSSAKSSSGAASRPRAAKKTPSQPE